LNPTRWSKRIGFRLAWMLAGFLLGAYFLLPLAWNLGLRTLGLPTLDQEIAELSDPAQTRLLPRSDLTLIAAHLLTGAVPEGPGRWQPDPARALAIDGALADYDQAYAWLSADREVLARSQALPFEPGHVFTEGLGRADRASAGKPFGDLTVGRISAPIWKAGELAGWLLIYGDPAHLGSQDEAGAVFVEGKGLEVCAISDRVLNLIATLFVVLAAGGLAVVVSRLITGRVTRLALQASTPVEDPRDLPGPFDECGGDEIAVLAKAMNAMRGRVHDLVGDLDRRDQDRRRWIAQVSHDLRTPLTALNACLERAEASMDDGRLDELPETLQVARHDAVRLAELIEDLLDIARLEADDTLVVEPVPPGELARQATRGLSALAQRAGVELVVEVDPGLPLLSADGRRLMRALENLLRNALHHARERVVLHAEAVDEGVRFSVEDDGHGLPVNDRGQVNLEGLADRRSRPDSAGLGLVVVRKVAEAHDGRVGAENADHGGARVWFEIPK
jgi:signal transduction histidine kinase